MDFSLLTENVLDEFLTQDYSEYNIFIDPNLTKVEQAKLLFDQLKSYPNLECPLPLLDLFLASQYRDSTNQRYALTNQRYALAELSNVTQDQINSFAKLFNMDPPITEERIIRILSYLGLVIHPKEVFLNPGVTDIMCGQLPIKDLGNLMESLGLISLNCVIPINDPDRYISQVSNIHLGNIPYLNQIESEGSIKTVTGLINDNRLNQLTYLLSNGLNPNLQNKYGYTTLMAASCNTHSETVNLLLQAGANPNLQNQYGCTALILVSYNGYLDIVKLLLQHGANSDLQDQHGRSALVLACCNNNPETIKPIVELLLQYETNHQSRLTALSLASSYGYHEIVELLNEVINHV